MVRSQMISLPNPAGLVSSTERRWVLIFAAVVMLVTSLPYLLAYSVQGSEWKFTGFVFGVEDGNSYIAKMLEGAAGAWLFRTPYSAEPQSGVIAFLPYLLLGKLTSPPGLHEQLVALYHLFRVVAGFLAILATYDFISIFCISVKLRRIALVLGCLGGGLGWVLIILGRSQWLGSLPLEFYSPESFGFLSLFGIPHLALARAALLWGLVVYLGISPGAGQKWYFSALKLGGLWLVSALAQPITAVVLGIVIGLHLIVMLARQLWENRRGMLNGWQRLKVTLRGVFIAGLIVLPFMAYNLLAFSLDPFLGSWTVQNIIRSPHPLHYLIAFGTLIPFAVLGSISVLRLDQWKGSLLVSWVLALPALAYIPFNLQRRFPEGVWIALVILAVLSIEPMAKVDAPGRLERVPKNRGYQWRFIFLLLFPSTIFLFVGGLLAALHPALPVFRPVNEVRAYEFLAQISPPGQVVLTSFSTGNSLPAWAQVRVVIGHGPESVGLASLIPQIASFFQPGTTDQTRLELLREREVDYVFWGPAERELGGWDLSQATYLKPVYQDGDYAVFKVSIPDQQVGSR